MGDYQATTDVSAPAERLFDYLKEVGNLPEYFAAMVEAESIGGGKVRTAAVVNGERNEGEANFKVDEGANRIEWSAPGPHDYSGWLEVSGSSDSSSVEVHVTTEHTEGDQVQSGVDDTVANIKRLVEQQGKA